MRVLVAFEESQAVTKALRKLGHEAYSCDIVPCSGGHPEWHFQQDVLPLLKEKWDMIIAFPPCTYFTTAGACRMYHKVDGVSVLDEERFAKAMEMRKLFMAFFRSRLSQNCRGESYTNESSKSSTTHTQVIQPYMFGHPWTKRTLLWLKGLPLLQPTNVVDPEMGSWVNGDATQYKKANGKHNGKSNATDRSKTFEGVARAMAEQWAGKVTEE